MDCVLAALNQAALFEQVTGNHVEVVVVPSNLFYRILSVGIFDLVKLNTLYVCLPAGDL